MMSRYVILEHDYPALHWDFMLEDGSALQTWRLAAVPAIGEAISAIHLFAHRLLYLDYEGPVSHGRGQVIRWDAGTFVWLTREEGKVAVQLLGDRLQGEVILQRVKTDEWSFSFTVQPVAGK